MLGKPIEWKLTDCYGMVIPPKIYMYRITAKIVSIAEVN